MTSNAVLLIDQTCVVFFRWATKGQNSFEEILHSSKKSS